MRGTSRALAKSHRARGEARELRDVHRAMNGIDIENVVMLTIPIQLLISRGLWRKHAALSMRPVDFPSSSPR